MKTVLILNGQYIPGYKGGGPIQSCLNMVENLSDHFKFKVLCADRDYKAEKPYENIIVDGWNKVGSAEVYYMSPEKQTLKGFQQVLNDTDYDVLYLNGFFSPIFTIKPLILRRMGRIKNVCTVLTPRGDFTGGLENKKVKKYGYISIAKVFGLYRNLVWHATSEIEERDIKRLFKKADTFMVPNLPAKYIEKDSVVKKEAGSLRLVFVSRIFPKKNIKYALEVLKNITEGNIVFDIYGPMEDVDYWNECKKIIKQMPQNVSVKYCGEVEHDRIPHIFEQYHAFFFPTLGENYGHVIVEAMMNNCLCVLSKGVTPWDDYIDGMEIGSELSDMEGFISIIKRLVCAKQDEISNMLDFNREYLKKHFCVDEDLGKYSKLFNF